MECKLKWHHIHHWQLQGVYLQAIYCDNENGEHRSAHCKGRTNNGGWGYYIRFERNDGSW